MVDFFGLDYKKGRKANRYYFCCPYCIKRGEPTPDMKYRLSVDMKTGDYICFRCGVKGRVGASSLIESFELLQDKPGEDELQKVRNKINGLFTIKKTDKIDLEQFSYELDSYETPYAYKYLKLRGFSHEEMVRYKLRVGKDYYIKDKDGQEKKVTRWSGRVLFPLIEEKQVKYVVGRSYAGKEPRYHNTKVPRASLIYGHEFIEEACILCEGPISAIAASRYTDVSGIACFGKPTLNQLMKLKSFCNDVFYSLDGDVERGEKRKVMSCLKRVGFNIWEVKIPVKEFPDGTKWTDPDDWKEEYTKFFKKAKKINII